MTRDLYIKLNAKIKMFLGICNRKKCYKRAIADIYIPQINSKRCLCREHFMEFQKMDLINSIKKK